MKLKTGDTVKILSGKDKGKTGKIMQIFPGLERIVVEGAGKRTRHLRPTKKGERGEKIEFSSPMARAKVQLVCSKCGKTTRISTKTIVEPTGKEKKVRVCKKCGETI